ncbi:MAG: SDR family NAD(P)-dependent oxidoreductase, partial [Bacteroidales bacterium]
MDIILTGASRGIGYETALSMAKNGHCRIMAIARNKAALERLSNEINAFQNGSQLFPIAIDLEQEDSI